MAQRCGTIPTNVVSSGGHEWSAKAKYDAVRPLTLDQMKILKRAVGKIVLFGKEVGVSTDEMILLLESGLSVGELLEYLVARTGQAC